MQREWALWLDPVLSCQTKSVGTFHCRMKKLVMKKDLLCSVVQQRHIVQKLGFAQLSWVSHKSAVLYHAKQSRVVQSDRVGSHVTRRCRCLPGCRPDVLKVTKCRDTR